MVIRPPPEQLCSDELLLICEARHTIIDTNSDAIFLYPVREFTPDNGKTARQIRPRGIAATDAVMQAPNIEQLSIATLMGEAMRRISEESSVSTLFD